MLFVLSFFRDRFGNTCLVHGGGGGREGKASGDSVSQFWNISPWPSHSELLPIHTSISSKSSKSQEKKADNISHTCLSTALKMSCKWLVSSWMKKAINSEKTTLKNRTTLFQSQRESLLAARKYSDYRKPSLHRVWGHTIRAPTLQPIRDSKLLLLNLWLEIGLKNKWINKKNI